MSPHKRERKPNESAELIRGINDIRNELKKIRRDNPKEDEAKEEMFIELHEQNEFGKRIDDLESKVGIMTTAIAEIKDFIFQNTTGARPFIHNERIKEAMLEQVSADRWKLKQPRELAADLMTVQRALNERREFAAANELQGLVEIAEVGREIVIMNPTAISWIGKGLEDAIGAVLCQGRERRGQSIFWECLQRQIIEKFAEQERKSNYKIKTQTPSNGTVNIPCQNCTKNGLLNVMHSVSECAKRRNPCRLECRLCPPEQGTNAIPCHWRMDCPTLQRQEQKSSSYRTYGFNR